jgi:hypothetical protein
MYLARPDESEPYENFAGLSPEPKKAHGTQRNAIFYLAED